MSEEAARTSETSVDNHFTRQYIPEDNSEQNKNMFISFSFNRLKANKRRLIFGLCI
jgi:hypothetical protein